MKKKTGEFQIILYNYKKENCYVHSKEQKMKTLKDAVHSFFDPTLWQQVDDTPLKLSPDKI